MAQGSEHKHEVANTPLRHIALVALGGNVASQAGTPAETMKAATVALTNDSVMIAAISRFFMTPCFPAGAGPDYTNAVAILSTVLSPESLLLHLHATEVAFGRQRLTRWGNRTLDLDLLAYDDLVRPDPETYKIWRDLEADAQRLRAPDQLILPHPRLHERAFVLVPLAQIAPGVQVPGLGRVCDLLQYLDTTSVSVLKEIAA